MVTAEQRALATADSPAPALDVVWDALASVPDPEVPVISIVDLGIVRDVAWRDGRLQVAVTPTYSGCPATELIAALIREKLAAIGFAEVDLVQQLAPPWTTDWMAPGAKARLAAFGIAPPQERAVHVDASALGLPRRASVPVPCPRCASSATRLVAQFGSTPCKAQYVCTACREPFDYFKPH